MLWILQIRLCFKHTWLSLYFSDIEPKQRATFDDLDEYMRYLQRYQDAIDFTKRYIISEGGKYILKDKFEKRYNQLAYAYSKFYQNTPNSHLDLNDENIGSHLTAYSIMAFSLSQRRFFEII